jgi:hypothetical protein
MSQVSQSKRTFLKKAGGVVIAAAATGAIPAIAHGHIRSATPVFLQETFVAGTAYYEATRLAPFLGAGDPLVLRRQPENPHDALAIEVLSVNGVKLGYVPRFINEPYARLMDDGRSVTARVAAVEDGRWRTDIRMALFLAA